MSTTTVPTTTAPPPPPAPPAVSPSRRARRTRRRRHPLRAHAVPHVAVGGLVVAAAAARLAVHLTGEQASVATWTAATAFVIAVVAATRAKRRIHDRATVRRVYLGCTVAVTWLTSTAATGLDIGAVGLLMALGYGLSLHWWRTHPVPGSQPRRPRPVLNAPAVPDEDEDDDGPGDEDPAQIYIDRWAGQVACARGALPGSRLADPEPIKAGVRYALHLVPGQQTQQQAEGLLDRLRGGLLLRRNQQLIIEAHPDLPEPHLQLTIVTRPPFPRSGIVWPGPAAFDSESGCVLLGPYADGESTARWRAYTSNRLWGGFIQGGTGSGKSRLIDSIAMSLAASESHPTVIWYADGQAGASSPLLMRHADLFAGTHERIAAMMAGLELLMKLRQRENVDSEDEGFTPTPERPGVLGVLDECHKALVKHENPDHWEITQRLAATIAREGGKVGVALTLASQEPTLNAFGGSGSPYCEALRSSLLTGNGIMLAGDDPNARQVFGVSANPKTFPSGGGYGYVAKPGPGDRAALFRAYYLDDAAKKSWPGRIVWRQLGGQAAAVVTGYATRERTWSDRRRVVIGEPLTVTDTTAAGPTTTSSAPTGQVLDLFGAQTFPAWSQYEAGGHRQGGRAPLAGGHRKILAAMAAGHRRPAALVAATGYSERQVYNLLDDLTAAGLVAKTGYGRYNLTRQAA